MNKIKIKLTKKLRLRVLKIYHSEFKEIFKLMISGTHTHSATAGFFNYFAFQISSLGYVKDAEDAIVDGIIEAVIAMG